MHRQSVSSSEAPAAIGPYSQAIQAEGRFLFISGQIPLTPSGEQITESVRAQAEQCVTNLRAILSKAGLTPDNIVKTTIFLSSMDHFATVNEVYGALFKADPPARATVAVAGLPKGVDVEIEAIAVY